MDNASELLRKRIWQLTGTIKVQLTICPSRSSRVERNVDGLLVVQLALKLCAEAPWPIQGYSPAKWPMERLNRL